MTRDAERMRSRSDRDRIPWQRDEPDLEGSLAVSVTPAKPTAWGKPRFRNAAASCPRADAGRTPKPIHSVLTVPSRPPAGVFRSRTPGRSTPVMNCSQKMRPPRSDEADYVTQARRTTSDVLGTEPTLLQAHRRAECVRWTDLTLSRQKQVFCLNTSNALAQVITWLISGARTMKLLHSSYSRKL